MLTSLGSDTDASRIFLLGLGLRGLTRGNRCHFILSGAIVRDVGFAPENGQPADDGQDDTDTGPNSVLAFPQEHYKHKKQIAINAAVVILIPRGDGSYPHLDRYSPQLLRSITSNGSIGCRVGLQFSEYGSCANLPLVIYADNAAYPQTMGSALPCFSEHAPRRDRLRLPCL